METTLLNKLQKPLFVHAQCRALGIISGKWISMRTELVDSNGLLLISKEYVRPQRVFELLIWLTEAEHPVRVVLSSTLAERTREGFGIGAQLMSMSVEDQGRWERFCRKQAAASTPGYADTLRLRRVLPLRHIVVLEFCLSPRMLDELGRLGMKLTTVRTPEKALRMARSGRVDLLIVAIDDPRYDGLKLCRRLGERSGAPPSLLLTGRDAIRDFEDGLCAGAKMVMAKPCDKALAVARILELLHEEGATASAALHPELAQGQEPPLPVRLAPSLLQQVSGHFLAWWLHARSFFHNPSFEQFAELTVS
jgi:CheY-like chemotaxis protein